jgi:hypothetical protein
MVVIGLEGGECSGVAGDGWRRIQDSGFGIQRTAFGIRHSAFGAWAILPLPLPLPLPCHGVPGAWPSSSPSPSPSPSPSCRRGFRIRDSGFRERHRMFVERRGGRRAEVPRCARQAPRAGRPDGRRREGGVRPCPGSGPEVGHHSGSGGATRGPVMPRRFALELDRHRRVLEPAPYGGGRARAKAKARARATARAGYALLNPESTAAIPPPRDRARAWARARASPPRMPNAECRMPNAECRKPSPP